MFLLKFKGAVIFFSTTSPLAVLGTYKGSVVDPCQEGFEGWTPREVYLPIFCQGSGHSPLLHATVLKLWGSV